MSHRRDFYNRPHVFLKTILSNRGVWSIGSPMPESAIRMIRTQERMGRIKLHHLDAYTVRCSVTPEGYEYIGAQLRKEQQRHTAV